MLLGIEFSFFFFLFFRFSLKFKRLQQVCGCYSPLYALTLTLMKTNLCFNAFICKSLAMIMFAFRVLPLPCLTITTLNSNYFDSLAAIFECDCLWTPSFQAFIAFFTECRCSFCTKPPNQRSLSFLSFSAVRIRACFFFFFF